MDAKITFFIANEMYETGKIMVIFVRFCRIHTLWVFFPRVVRYRDSYDAGCEETP